MSLNLTGDAVVKLFQEWRAAQDQSAKVQNLMQEQITVLQEQLNSAGPVISAALQRLAPDVVTSASAFKDCCSLLCQNMRLADTELKDSSTLVKEVGYVDIGQALSLFALLPAAGGQLVKQTGDHLTKLLIPDAAKIAVRWKIQYGTAARNLFPATWQEARPATSTEDCSGQYQILDGNLESPFLKFVPWPEPVVVADTLTDNDRWWKISLQVTTYLPTDVPTSATSSGLLSQSLYCKVPPWSRILGSSGTKTNRLLPESGTGGMDFNFLRDMFHVHLDNPKPRLGEVSVLTLVPNEKTSTMPTTLESIVDASPDLDLKAAFDVGAPIENILSAVVKAITSLFGASGTASAVANQISAGVLDVSSVLAGAMSIPIAVKYKGNSVSKTFKPLAGVVGPRFVTVPNAATGLQGCKMLGQLPIGSITAVISTTSEDLVAKSLTAGAYNKQSVLDSVLGLSILTMPSLTVMSDGIPDASSMALELTLRPKLRLPGSKETISLELNLGRVSISIPTVPVPQVLMFFKQTLDSSAPQDVLIAPDPISRSFLPNVTTVTAALQTLLIALKLLNENKIDDLPGLNAAQRQMLMLGTTQMLERLENAPTKTMMPLPFPKNIFSKPDLAGQQIMPSDWKKKIQGVLWIGFGTERDQDYRPWLLFTQSPLPAADSYFTVGHRGNPDWFNRIHQKDNPRPNVNPDPPKDFIRAVIMGMNDSDGNNCTSGTIFWFYTGPDTYSIDAMDLSRAMPGKNPDWRKQIAAIDWRTWPEGLPESYAF